MPRWARASAVLAVALLAGCGGGEDGGRAPSGAPSPTMEATGEDDDALYELDVIAEAEPDEGEPPLTVQFLGYVEEDEGGPWRFHWEFGDGATSSEQNPVHTYQRLGEYTATLRVTDRHEKIGTDEIDVFVEPEDY